MYDPGELVDLNALQRQLDANRSLDDFLEYESVRRLVTEARVNRKVVDAARSLIATTGFAAPEVYEERRLALAEALAVRDKALEDS
jgi:hypothetical protein